MTQPRNRLQNASLLFIACIILGLSASFAYAQTENSETSQISENNNSGYIYSPEGCDFQVLFPQEPFNTRRCHPDFPDQCDIMTSFTKVFELDSTLTFYVSCSPLPQGEYNQFNADVMRTLLIARGGNRLETKETAYNEVDDVKMASVIGAGDANNGTDILLYISQIWVSETSLFTIEGELVGNGNPDADQAFANILRSLGRKNKPAEATEAPKE